MTIHDMALELLARVDYDSFKEASFEVEEGEAEWTDFDMYLHTVQALQSAYDWGFSEG